MKTQQIRNQTPMYKLSLEEKDWKSFTAEEAKRTLTLLLGARRFEEAILDLDKRGLVHGPAHSSIGQEGATAGCLAALAPTTKITATHRAHHQVVAKMLHALWAKNFDPAKATQLPEDMREITRTLLADILGLKEGWSGGRGGSMHLRNDAVGVVGTQAIVASGMAIGCGIAWAEKVRQSGDLTVAFFGDGAIHQGTAHEALNLAALYELPMIFFMENNQYSVSMSIEQSTRESELLTRAQGHGIPSLKLNGMNPLAAYRAAEWAGREISEKRGPVLIQADVYRYYHQSAPYPGSAFGYRSKDEEESWRKKDPLDFLIAELDKRKILGKDDSQHIDSLVKDAVQAAVDSCVEGRGSSARIKPDLWPDPATVDNDITGDLSEFEGARFAEPEDYAANELDESRLIDVMPRVVAERMAEDESIYVLGEDVANMGGGTVGATKGLMDRFPERVVNTPINENGFCNMAAGMASAGLKPIVELMYSDFMFNATDALLNQIAKMRHLFGGRYSVPLVLRCRIPGTEGYGSQHSMDPSGIFAMFPGWRIVAPATPFDYAGLMNAALRCQDPVLVVEHQSLQKKTGPVPEKLDYHIPIGKARKVADGHQVTLLTTLTMCELARETAKEMGISADILDLRSLSQRDIDYEAIEESVRKTNNVAIVEQSTRGTSLGAFLSDEIQRRCFDHLDQPVKRVVGRWAAPTVSKALEQAAVAGRGDIEETLREMLADTAQRAAA
ncbi:alpha-ketoacid dehydrogenase subunit alpha/beta [Fodinicurvata fenggangensis]|uniref:alpha-ketoacid dehydrogenase subunit alpha/beta n=1 Tax=Fodinicurvata fenggangensis TaxID=1121830 RepID=UPI00047876EA|nr:alpha-ketoacid dehydrogenase subunit alpha/beta [Fodinicurvata fenggangensis]